VRGNIIKLRLLKPQVMPLRETAEQDVKFVVLRLHHLRCEFAFSKACRSSQLTSHSELPLHLMSKMTEKKKNIIPKTREATMAIAQRFMLTLRVANAAETAIASQQSHTASPMSAVHVSRFFEMSARERTYRSPTYYTKTPWSLPLRWQASLRDK
jgi:hypothetical protein